MLKTTLSKTALSCQFLLLIILSGNKLMAQSSDAYVQVSSLDLKGKQFRYDTGYAGVNDLPANITAAEPLTEVKAPTIKLHPRAVSFVANYLKEENEMLVKIKGRSAPYFKIIETLFRKYNLPVELKYLAVIESKLKATAVSHVGAVGPWQLMPQTARELGLKVSSKNDERTHYYKSTVAVCKYLKDLYAEYEDWLLVIAAYNAGPGRVNKAIKLSGSRNFWHLQSFLPAETRGHVKRFIGAHYYFEQNGSETTLTKNEATAYRKALSEYKAYQEQLVREPENRDEEEEPTAPVDIINVVSRSSMNR